MTRRRVENREGSPGYPRFRKFEETEPMTIFAQAEGANLCQKRLCMAVGNVVLRMQGVISENGGYVEWDRIPRQKSEWSGYVKSLVYADKPQTLDHLEDNIRRVIADIRPQMLEKVIENWTSRLDYIPASRGSSKPEIIFKM
ncbi:hypothetical protein TNCV_2567461 [Trichonephila clavipes]|uniref:Uncharacterized protein n=1 Tax=Trichonephila clavipes TaxID=2585209 RepID=A0A8X7BNQ1_TRICX|nr:hypothetical protein TNCV_2567461 [Trichonephila clavipes]